jgi:general stress protein 26
MTAHTAHPEDAHEQLWERIAPVRFGMLTTRSRDGGLRSRPLTTQNKALEADATLWYFVDRDSEVVADVEEDAVVHVAYAHPDKQLYVSLSGVARTTDDAVLKQRLWSAMDKPWFDGPEDPRLTVIGVRIDRAEYWDAPSSKMVQLFAMAKAAITGERAHPGEHTKVNL